MANEATILRIRAQVENLEGLNRVRSAVRNFATESKIASSDLDKLYSSLKQLNTESVRSVNNLQNYRNGLDSLRKSAEIGGTTFNKLTSEIKQLDIQLGKLQTSQASGVGAVNKIGQSIGAVAAAGVFGGPEGLIGAGIGAIGGPGGALAGGAIGAQVGMIRQSIGATAEYAAQVDKLNIALKSIAGTSSEYAKAQALIESSARDLNIPVLESTQSFTKLAASVNGAGGKITDAAFVFRSFAQAIKATGGGVEETNGVMVALTQIFSKGKVSAEEVNQIAERLPGTFTLFAKAAGKTGPEMQKAFEQGAIGLNDLMKFAAELDKKYAASAANMATSTEESGARMKVALDALTYSFGQFFKPIGAGFQEAITGIATFANEWIKSVSKIIESVPYLQRALEVLGNISAKGIVSAFVQNTLPAPLGPIASTILGLSSGQKTKPTTPRAIPQLPSDLTIFAPPKGGGTAGGAEKSNKAAENAAQRLKEKIKQQLADADKLFSLETARLDITLAATKQEELEAKYNKVIVERREKYLSLQKNAVSEQERMRIAEAQSVAIIADHQTYLGEINKLMQDQTKELYAQVGLSATLNKNLQAALAGAFTGGTATGTFRTDVDLMPGLTGGELGSKIEELKKSLADLQDPIKQVMAGAQAIGEAFSTSFKGLIDGSMSAQEALAGFFKSIANHFLDMASQMIAKYIEMQIIGLAQKFLPSIGGIFGGGGAPNFSGASLNMSGLTGAAFGGTNLIGSANGNVFAQNGIVPYAKGGIVDRPMMFPFAKGIGLMGEAGPEAIMPLKRGADGKLGVAGGGGGGTTVNVNVDATGSSVEGDQAQGKQLGVAISAAVQAELIKQQRPGGLLAGTRR